MPEPGRGPALAQVSGRPTAATIGAQTVTIIAQDADGDANIAAGDRATLTFQVTVADRARLRPAPRRPPKRTWMALG